MNTIIKSRLIAGAMKYGQWGPGFTIQELSNLISETVDIGVHAFDHADIYGDYEEEERFGRALKQSGIDRKSIQLITKCGIRLLSDKHPEDYIKHYRNSKEYIISQAEKSLMYLGTDYIDVLLIHRPSPLMNPLEMAEAFVKLKDAGKVLHFGASNFTTSQYAMLHSYFPLVTNQVEASLLHLDPFLDGTFDQALELKSPPTIWSPLAGGRLFNEQDAKAHPLVLSKVQTLAEELGVKIDQLLLAFLLKHPAQLIPILGTTKISRLKDAVAALDIELTDQQWFELWTSSTGFEVP